jgi:predicted DNA-binding protein
MEIQSPRGKVVFLRLAPDSYEQLAALRKQSGSRGVATIVKMIVEKALKEGVSVAKENRKGAKNTRYGR